MSRPSRRSVQREALALLELGLELLVSEGWARGAYARDRHRHPVNPTSPRAVRYCASGALIQAEFELHGEPFEESEEAGIEGSDRLLLALSHLAFACSALILEPLLRLAPAKDARSRARALAAPFHQLPDLANEMPGVERDHIVACYLLALRTAERSVRPRRRKQSAGGRRRP